MCYDCCKNAVMVGEKVRYNNKSTQTGTTWCSLGLVKIFTFFEIDMLGLFVEVDFYIPFIPTLSLCIFYKIMA